MWNPTSPLTGAAMTGFTSPTYTLTQDMQPRLNGEQVIISGIGGTQVGVDTHSVSNVFTLSGFRPVNFKQLPAVGNNGALPNVPMNTYKVICRKGVLPLANQPRKTALVTITIDVPAGSDIADPASLKAMLSCAFGAVWQQSSGLGDSILTGTL